jgi:hypothetical protein
VVLDATNLTEMFSPAYDSNVNYQHNPTKAPSYHAAKNPG